MSQPQHSEIQIAIPFSTLVGAINQLPTEALLQLLHALRPLWPHGLLPGLRHRCSREKMRNSGRVSWDSTLQRRPMIVLPSKTYGKPFP